MCLFRDHIPVNGWLIRQENRVWVTALEMNSKLKAPNKISHLDKSERNIIVDESMTRICNVLFYFERLLYNCLKNFVLNQSPSESNECGCQILASKVIIAVNP